MARYQQGQRAGAFSSTFRSFPANGAQNCQTNLLTVEKKKFHSNTPFTAANLFIFAQPYLYSIQTRENSHF